MRGYEFDKLISQIGHGQEDWVRFVQDADEMFARCGASDEEKAAFLGGDVQALYRWGVNGYLLLRYARWHSKDNVRVVQELQADDARAGRPDQGLRSSDPLRGPSGRVGRLASAGR